MQGPATTILILKLADSPMFLCNVLFNTTYIRSKKNIIQAEDDRAFGQAGKITLIQNIIIPIFAVNLQHVDFF